MGVVRVRERSFKNKVLSSFIGGQVDVPRADHEMATFTNLEIRPDGWGISRRGAGRVTTGSITSSAILGLGTVTIEYGRWIVVAKSGSGYWYTIRVDDDIVGGGGWVATTLTPSYDAGASPVRMESVIDSAGVGWGVFACPDFATLVKWDGDSASTAEVTGSPASPRYIRVWNQYLFCVADSAPTTIQFSNSGDPFSWPATSKIIVEASFGVITGLEANPDMLLVFTDNVILALVGDPGDPTVGYKLIPIVPNVGCDVPGSIVSVAGRTAFVYRGTGYMFEGGSDAIMSDRIRDFANFLARKPGVTGLVSSSYAAMSPLRYAYRPCINNGSSPAASPDSDSFLYTFDRARYNAWSVFDYPRTSKVGATDPVLPVILFADDYSLLIAGGDGELYCQPIRADGDVSMSGDAAVTGTDIPVLSTLVTRVLTFGDSTMQKQYRRILVGGYSASGSASIGGALLDPKETSISATILSGAQMPMQTDLPTVDGINGPSLWGSIQIQVQGANMLLRNITIQWRGVRWSTDGAL